MYTKYNNRGWGLTLEKIYIVGPLLASFEESEALTYQTVTQLS